MYSDSEEAYYAVVDDEDAAEDTPIKTLCRNILCTRLCPIRIDRIPWYTSGFQ